jgi:hypothetical protein
MAKDSRRTSSTGKGHRIGDHRMTGPAQEVPAISRVYAPPPVRTK